MKAGRSHYLYPTPEYQIHPNTVTRLVWYSNGKIVSGCQMIQYSNGGPKTGLKKAFYGLKCQVFEWTAKSLDLLFEYWTTKNKNYLLNLTFL